ncbi:MAG: HDOD domain-containing protein [candidate division Zixibacteria bacterium]|nr:HDOD domain-containing protein [candidate division Zixibacteria bacterium]
MNKEQIFTRVKENVKLSTLPQTLSEVLSTLDDDTSSADKIASIIKNDVSLTAKILRVANSPFYGRVNGIATVSSAIVLLGTRSVQALALSVSVYELLNKNDSENIDLRLFWRHSLETAILGRKIAEKVGYPTPEEAFVSGLMHDVGILLLNQEFPEDYSSVLKSSAEKTSFHERENDVFDCNHADVAGHLCKTWNLPERICSAIENHHNLNGAKRSPEPTLDYIIYAAEKLSRFNFDNSTGYAMEDKKQRDEIIELLKVPTGELSTLTKPLLDEVATTAQFLDIDIGSPMELVTTANEMLFDLYASIDDLLREQVILQERLVSEEKKKSAIKSLRIILATLSHYINNATASILGRAQLLGYALSKGEVSDNSQIVATTVEVIQKAVDNISAVLEELKVLEDFETVPYYENSSIINIEQNVRKRMRELEMKK